MVSSKERVLSYIKQYTREFAEEERPAITTQFLSEQFAMQRTNMSSLLNRLCQEGSLEKLNGRPVRYLLKEDVKEVKMVFFHQLIGYEGSMQEALRKVKTILLWPQIHPMFFIAPYGSGMRYMAGQIALVAQELGVLDKDAEVICIDCLVFAHKPEELHEILFGVHGELSIAHRRLVLLKNIQILTGYDRNQLCRLIEEKTCSSILLCSMPPHSDDKFQELLCEICGGNILLPTLSERPLSERLELVQSFFQEEVGNAMRSFEVDSNVMQNLLLYPDEKNIRGLKNTIHAGCANAYARVQNHKKTSIHVQLLDFPSIVYKGILLLEEHKQEVEKLLPYGHSYVFRGNKMIEKDRPLSKDWYRELQESMEKGTPEERLSLFTHTLYCYADDLAGHIHDHEQLKKLVSTKLIHLVEELLHHVEQDCNIEYPIVVCYSLCQHIDAAIRTQRKQQMIKNDVIKLVLSQHEKIYQTVKQFLVQIKNVFGVPLYIDDLVMIILILSRDYAIQKVGQLQSAFILSGISVADALQESIQDIFPNQSIHAFNVTLHKAREEIYLKLKSFLMKIDQGKGILVLYDQGSIRIMCESIASEIGCTIRCIQLPVTQMGISMVQEAAVSDDIEAVYASLSHQYHEEAFRNIKQRKPSILLLDQGDGVKNNRLLQYLKIHYQGEEVFLSLSVENSVELYTYLDTLSKEYEVIGMIGERNPNLHHIPSCTAAHVYACSPCNAKQLFVKQEDIDKELYEVMVYLQEQFSACDMEQLKPLMLQFLSNLKEYLMRDISMDKQIEIVLHMSCLIERLLHHEYPTVNFEAAAIMREDSAKVQAIKKLLKPIEKSFHVSINDSEAATIVSIIK